MSLRSTDGRIHEDEESRPARRFLDQRERFLGEPLRELRVGDGRRRADELRIRIPYAGRCRRRAAQRSGGCRTRRLINARSLSMTQTAGFRILRLVHMSRITKERARAGANRAPCCGVSPSKRARTPIAADLAHRFGELVQLRHSVCRRETNTVPRRRIYTRSRDRRSRSTALPSCSACGRDGVSIPRAEPMAWWA